MATAAKDDFGRLLGPVHVDSLNQFFEKKIAFNKLNTHRNARTDVGSPITT